MGSTSADDADDAFPDRLARAQAEDPRAFDELVGWLERPLLGFVRARGAPEPEDLANEVLVQVFRGIGDFDGNAAQFRAWVFRIARNRIIDEHRRGRRRPDTTPVAPEDLPELHGTTDLGDHLGEHERVEALLAGLGEDQREVLMLRIVAGLSVEETAEVLERRPGAVRALQHRALARIRRNLSRSP